jgi:hypothetical protein
MGAAPAWEPSPFLVSKTRDAEPFVFDGHYHFLISMLGCVTPVLIGLLAVLSISGSMG